MLRAGWSSFAALLCGLTACSDGALEPSETAQSAATPGASVEEQAGEKGEHPLGVADYQVGEEWGRVSVSLPTTSRAALATAYADGGTAFFLGELGGALVAATNHHVFPRAESCVDGAVLFTALRVRGTCTRLLGTWPEIELALFTIEVPTADDRRALIGVGANFDFAAQVRRGQRLTTVGFGVAANPDGRMMSNADADCRVFSPTGEFRLLKDPDTVRPESYPVWSFAHGCDSSHGDSGSAMIDRATGKPIGIHWTAKVPQRPRDRQALERLPEAEIWTELGYGVPATKIREVVARAARAAANTSDAAILAAVVGER